jgi:hypothetical protein
MNPHTPKWVPTLGVGVLLEFWTFKEQLQGSKPIGLKSSLYFWKYLGMKMSKMGSHDPFGKLTHKLWSKEGSGLPFRSPMTKWHLGAGPVAKHIIYYKGEGGGFPRVRVVVSLVNPCLLMTRPCTKVLQLRTNQLVVWFVQVCVNDWSACQSFWSHPRVLTHPSTPQSVANQRVHPNSFSFRYSPLDS